MNLPSVLSRNKPDKALIQFRYSALDESGKKFTGTESATSLGAAHLALIQRGLQPVELKEKKNILAFEITKKLVPRSEVMNFTRQLAVFMKAGVSIMEALEVIVEETQNKLLRRVIFDLIDSLRAGDTFATACAAHPEAFPNFYVGILESAELTGNLDQVLNQLADYIDRDQAARTKITSALIYPSVVAAMSVVTVLVLAVFVMPRFKVFFASLHAKLPLVTRMLIAIANFIGHWWYAEALFVLLIVGGFIAMRRSTKGRAQLDAIMLKLPVIGELTQTAVLERTCRILSSMLRAGVEQEVRRASAAGASATARKALGFDDLLAWTFHVPWR